MSFFFFFSLLLLQNLLSLQMERLELIIYRQLPLSPARECLFVSRETWKTTRSWHESIPVYPCSKRRVWKVLWGQGCHFTRQSSLSKPPPLRNSTHSCVLCCSPCASSNAFQTSLWNSSACELGRKNAFYCFIV